MENCNALWTIPLRDLNPDAIKEIRGDQLWWNELEDNRDDIYDAYWKSLSIDESMKQRLGHVFKHKGDAQIRQNLI